MPCIPRRLFLGAAAALVPASCSSAGNVVEGNGGAGGGKPTTSSGMSTASGMDLDGGDGGTLVDLDGDVDAPFMPDGGGDANVS